MTKKKNKRKRPNVVSFNHNLLDTALGGHGSDRRETVCRRIRAAFSRRGMNINLDKIAAGSQGPSVASLYLLSQELKLPMERFMQDDIVRLEREARENPPVAEPLKDEEGLNETGSQEVTTPEEGQG